MRQLVDVFIATLFAINIIQCWGHERNLLQETPKASVIVDKVVFEDVGKIGTVTITNIGDKETSLSGWTFGSNAAIACVSDIIPSQTIAIPSKTVNTTCGVDFSGIKGTLALSDSTGKVVSEVTLSTGAVSNYAMVHVAWADKAEYISVSEDKVSVLSLLQEAGIFNTFLEALQIVGLDKTLHSASPNPAYKGPQIPRKFGVAATNFSKPEIEWWEGKEGTVAPSPPPPPPPPPPAGMPEMGPFTVMAPTDAAFERLMDQLGGFGGKLPKEDLMKLDQLQQMIEYHILPGLYATEYMFNNTPMRTAEGTTLVAIRDPKMVGGRIALHDSCIDKPTPDDYDCRIQLDWGKCWDPFMVSPLGAQWQGGFCQRTCQRCTCDLNSGVICSNVVARNMVGTNGIVHAIDRVLFPPPRFSKEEEKKYATGEIPSYNTKMPGAIIIGQLPEAKK